MAHPHLKISISTTLLLLLAFLAGCGYVVGFKSEETKTLGLPGFSNHTFKPGLEVLARDLLQEKLTKMKVPLVRDPQGADRVLKGTVTSYSKDAAAFDAEQVSRQYRLTISVDFVLTDKGSERTSWEETVSGTSYYYTGPDVATTEISEYEASVRALEEVSQFLANRLLEGF